MAALPASSPDPDEATMGLAVRLARVLGDTVRPEGRFNLTQFLGAIENQMGGTLVIRAPSGREKRAITEVRYASDGIVFTPTLHT